MGCSFNFISNFTTIWIFFQTSAVFQVITAVIIDYCLLGCNSVKSSKKFTKERFSLKHQ